MPRYFIEVAYRGTNYSGFQVQENAHTVQAEIQKAFAVLHRRPVEMTGSSRTDAGVHALQNYFHFDDEGIHEQFIYKMNALLPEDVAVRAVYRMDADAHCRFDAVARRYRYQVHTSKDPFLRDRSLYFPYRVDFDRMQRMAERVKGVHDFYAFSKTNTQVKHYECRVEESTWERVDGGMMYEVEANRFLRGMVRALTAAMLKVGRGKMEEWEFDRMLRGEGKAGVSVSPWGLFLERVRYPENYFVARGVGLGGI